MDYRLRRGETLSAVAQQFNTTVERLARANHIEDPDAVAAGTRLRIPDGFEAGEDDDALELAPSTSQPWVSPGNLDLSPRPPPPPGAGRDLSGLGSLSARYESNGDPATVSSGRGDAGGVSYGAYQFATKPGAARAFSAWLQRTQPALGRPLAGLTPGTQAFSNAWRAIARQHPQAFLAAQHRFVGERYYLPALDGVERAARGLDFSRRSVALSDVLWSTAVHHGSAGAVTVFTRALAGRNASQLTDAQLISAVYAERGRRNRHGQLAYFTSSSRAVQAGVAARLVQERADALASV